MFKGNVMVVQALVVQPDPMHHFREYLQARDDMFPLCPELWLLQSSSILTRSWFMKCLRHYFPPSISGHFLCADGATSLAEAGVAPDVIQAAGRWSSDTWCIYVCKHPLVLHALMHGRPAHQTSHSDPS